MPGSNPGVTKQEYDDSLTRTRRKESTLAEESGMHLRSTSRALSKRLDDECARAQSKHRAIENDTRLLHMQQAKRINARVCQEALTGPEADGTITLVRDALAIISVQSYVTATGAPVALEFEDTDFSVSGAVITELLSADQSANTWVISYTSVR